MKKIFLITFTMLLNFSFGQITKNVGDFNKVTSFDKIDVLLIKSDENKIILNGSDANEVELINKNGELKIRMPLSKSFSGDNISATVFYTNLDAVEANEESKIASEEFIESIDFMIITKEGGKVDLKLKTDKLNARASSGGIIILEGTAKNQDVVLNSGGIYKASTLESNQIIIAVNAGGKAEIKAKDLVEAKVRAGGKIIIYGKPKQINQKTFLGGTIEEFKN
jgi:Putative auto-transporter adhesin, head GIN domain